MDEERFITPRQRAIHESFVRTKSQSETARELNISQIRVREALVQRERNLIRAAGERPHSLKRMQQGDVTTRNGVSRDLRRGRPAKHLAVGRKGEPCNVNAAVPRARPTIEVIGSTSQRRLIITGVNAASPRHAGFIANLRAYAAHLDGELRIHVIGDQEASGLRGLTGGGPAANGHTVVGDAWEIRGDIVLPRYARFPLDGLQRVAPGRSAILLHATPQLESLPRLAAQRPRIQMTSGLASISHRVAGSRVLDELELLGAVIVEIGVAGDVHVRRISAMADGEGGFHDLDVRVSGGNIQTGVRAEAVVFGDIHHPFAAKDVVAATWGPGGLLERVRPRHQVLHDLADFHARSHHDARDHHARFARFAAGRDDVRAELAAVSEFVASTRRPGSTTHVIASNHDLALTRWLRDTDHRADPRNAEFYLDCERMAYARIREGADAGILPEVLRSFASDRLDGVEFVSDGESLLIAGVEHALHGDRGPNGKRGSISYLESMGMDMTVGHFHRPTIRGGVYVAGLCSSGIGYERGPTSRCVAHVVTHADGTRQHVFHEAAGFLPDDR